jgi:hypothetical protein
LPQSLHYAADRWVLYDIADCELHDFVDADAQKNVQRLYWVQFEGYIPVEVGVSTPIRFSATRADWGSDFYMDTRK